LLGPVFSPIVDIWGGEYIIPDMSRKEREGGRGANVEKDLGRFTSCRYRLDADTAQSLKTMIGKVLPHVSGVPAEVIISKYSIEDTVKLRQLLVDLAAGLLADRKWPVHTTRDKQNRIVQNLACNNVVTFVNEKGWGVPTSVLVFMCDPFFSPEETKDLIDYLLREANVRLKNLGIDMALPLDPKRDQLKANFC